jgi:hypothetical protein
MRTRTTLVLAAAGAAVLALGLIYGTGPGEKTNEAPQGRLVFPDLAPKLAAATRLELTHKGTTLEIARKDTAPDTIWVLPARGNYRAVQDKVRELLANLTELRLDEPRTSDPSEYARLGVEDPKDKSAGSTLLRVLDAKGGVIAALVVGHSQTAARGSLDTLYVRRPDATQAWLADGRLAVSTDAQDWLDRDIVNIDAAKVASVTVTRDGQTLNFARKDNKLTLTAPADHPKLDDFKVDEVSRALSNLMLEDVKQAPAPGTPLGRAVVTTTDGMTVTADVNKSGPAIWATFTAEGKGDAAALEAKVKGWAYEIGSWKEQALVPTLDDLKAPAPSPAPAASPATPTPASPSPAPAK